MYCLHTPMSCDSIVIIIAINLLLDNVIPGSVLAFHPVYIGAEEEPEVRQIKHWENKLLRAICGKASLHGLDNYPWAVSVTLKDRNLLGGVIISRYHILTAAHPFLNFIGYSIAPCKTTGYKNIDELQRRKVLYGGKCIRGNVTNITNDPACEEADVLRNRIRAVVIDGDFMRADCMKGHDWAIIEVERPLVFTSKVRPICLPQKNEELQDVLMIFGWGRTSSFFEGSPLIHETPMQRDVHCQAPVSDKMPTKVDDYICMKSLDPKRVDTPRICYGDSGCGMQQLNDEGVATVVGITSYGLKGCPPNELARFTRVDRYLDEICDITGICYTIQN